MPFAPELLMIDEETVSVWPASTETESVPAEVPPAVRRPAPEMVVAVVELLIKPPPARFRVRALVPPRSRAARLVTFNPLSVVVPALVRVYAVEDELPSSSTIFVLSLTLIP